MAYTTTPADNEVIANLPGDIRAVTATVTAHTGATSGAHQASAISYGSGNVKSALDTASAHAANKNNPHGVTPAQIGAVEAADAVTTISAGKVVRRDDNGKVAGDITGNAATATHIAWSGITGAPSTFTPPVASTSTLGGVKQGSNVTIAADGTLSIASPFNYSNDATFTASKQGALNVYFISSTNNSSAGLFKTSTGIGAGTYTLVDILQCLVNVSHSHTGSSPSNCNSYDCSGGNN